MHTVKSVTTSLATASGGNSESDQSWDVYLHAARRTRDSVLIGRGIGLAVPSGIDEHDQCQKEGYCLHYAIIERENFTAICGGVHGQLIQDDVLVYFPSNKGKIFPKLQSLGMTGVGLVCARAQERIHFGFGCVVVDDRFWEVRRVPKRGRHLAGVSFGVRSLRAFGKACRMGPRLWFGPWVGPECEALVKQWNSEKVGTSVRNHFELGVMARADTGTYGMLGALLPRPADVTAAYKLNGVLVEDDHVRD
jgi:hypothetical protein